MVSMIIGRSFAPGVDGVVVVVIILGVGLPVHTAMYGHNIQFKQREDQERREQRMQVTCS
jgi:uncharacterized membrane protein